MPSPRSGCSSVRRYRNSNIPKRLFCGPAGGACPGTYPVNTPRRARAALSYARHAPNPEGIRRCARRVAKEEGWTNALGKIGQKKRYSAKYKERLERAASTHRSRSRSRSPKRHSAHKKSKTSASHKKKSATHKKKSKASSTHHKKTKKLSSAHKRRTSHKKIVKYRNELYEVSTSGKGSIKKLRR